MITVQWIRIAALTAAVLAAVVACGPEVLMRDISDSAALPSYPIDHSLRVPPRDYVVGSRQAEADAARAAILARIPTEESRMQFLRRLDGRPERETAGVFSHSRIEAVSDPEMARLISIIYQIRYADHHARDRETSRHRARSVPARVTVMLVDSLRETDGVAVLVRGSRTPENVVLLSRRAPSLDVVRHAFVLLAELRGLDGDYVLEVQRHSVRATSEARVPDVSFAAALGSRLEKLSSAERLTVEGVGEGPAITVYLHPVSGSITVIDPPRK